MSSLCVCGEGVNALFSIIHTNMRVFPWWSLPPSPSLSLSCSSPFRYDEGDYESPSSTGGAGQGGGGRDGGGSIDASPQALSLKLFLSSPGWTTAPTSRGGHFWWLPNTRRGGGVGGGGGGGPVEFAPEFNSMYLFMPSSSAAGGARHMITPVNSNAALGEPGDEKRLLVVEGGFAALDDLWGAWSAASDVDAAARGAASEVPSFVTV